MIVNLSERPSIITHYIAQLRDVAIQTDRIRFRTNLTRIGELIGIEISRTLPYTVRHVQTPLGMAPTPVLAEQPVLATILRAGLVLHEGLLRVFDEADHAFVSAYRKHRPDGSFDIELEYQACPALAGRIVIVSDPMLASGASIALTLEKLFSQGRPKAVHIACAIAAKPGIERVTQQFPDATIWAGAIDPELDSRAYIVPGLGDAGDLAFGSKVQR